MRVKGPAFRRLVALMDSARIRVDYKLREKTNIAVVSIDSLRYDVTAMASQSGFRALFDADELEGWQRVYSPATDTLPAHLSFFHAGILPSMKDPDAEPIYNREELSFFRPILKWNRNRRALYPTPEAPNIVKGFKRLGYDTIGIGGVHWFNLRFKTSAFWRGAYFSEFHWEEAFHKNDPDSLERQIEKSRDVLAARPDPARPLFYFLNIAGTHNPYRKMGDVRTLEAQAEALEYVDAHISGFAELLPRPCHVVLLGDHGECFGEDGLYGHGFYRPKVMEVPMVHFILEGPSSG